MAALWQFLLAGPPAKKGNQLRINVHLEVQKETLTKKQVPRGVIIVDSEKLQKNICRRFKAEITILNHSTTISNNYQPVVHCGLVRQAARIKIIENLAKDNKKKNGNKLRTGNKAIVEFKFSFKIWSYYRVRI